MLGSFYDVRPKHTSNNFVKRRKRCEDGERELADLSGNKKKQVEVFPSETRFTDSKKRRASFTGWTILKDHEKRLVGV